ncbi:CDP-alcohol phosphatidyltransferase family protein [Pendulispora rubella]|uniref:CDP-alcohol phosphatidyltransferase family protein n=1 Tax=Pendulispora rubella TaxID=2741070 RepID=A0ABZ2KQH6_9BACT
MATYSLRDLVRTPNLISLARLPLAVAFPWVVRQRRWPIPWLTLAAATDVLDGWYARTFHEETATGAALDAVMDKAFVLTVVATLVRERMLTLFDAVLLETRDLGEIPLLLRAASGHDGPSAPRSSNVAGKAVTVLQFATLVATLSRMSRRRGWVLATSACGIFAAATYWIREARAAR